MGKKPTKKPTKKEEDIDELDEELFTSDVDEEFPDLELKEKDKNGREETKKYRDCQ